MAINKSIKIKYRIEGTVELADLIINSDMDLNIIKKSLYLRTDLAERSEDGGSLNMSGVMVDIGPFIDEYNNGEVYGFFQYKPSYINSFEHVNVRESELTRLSSTENNSWGFTAENIDSKKSYQYRACVRVKTNNNIYHFFGKAYTIFKKENLELSGLKLRETFVDARDLSTETGLVNRGLEKLAVEKVESWNEKEFRQWVWNKLNNIINTEEIGIDYLDYYKMTDEELSSLLAAFSSSTVSELSGLSRIEVIIQLNNEINNLTQEEIDQSEEDNLRLLTRLLTGDTNGVYKNWTASELKCLLAVILFGNKSFEAFLGAFPFSKWDKITKQKLNLTVIDSTTIKVEYLEEGPYDYMKDFIIGDVVAVEYPGIFTAVSRVVEVEDIYNETNRKYKIVLGREAKDVTKKLETNVGRRL
ncbi:MAG TPA: hypothetical protein VJ962_06820 [Clostridia bacterium]|nr:hypothetical protein [Clostridia bacterium]